MREKISYLLLLLVALGLAAGCGPSAPAEPTHAVVYKYEDGTTPDRAIPVIQGDAAQLPEDPVRENFGFKGWFTQPGGKGERITAETVPASDLTAYAHWADFVDMTGRNRIEIGGFNGITEFIQIPLRDPETNEILRDEEGEQIFGPMEYAEEEDFRLLAELGVDTIYMTFEHWDLYPDDAHKQRQKPYIEWLNKYNIKCWFNDNELKGVLELLGDPLDFDDPEAVAAAVAEVRKYTAVYRDEPCFKGNYYEDEPDQAKLTDYVKRVKLYQIAMPGCEMYMNLLPNYAYAFHMDQTDELYTSYLRYFAENFDTSYLAIDNYGINATKTVFGTVTRSIRPDYYWRCFRVAGEIARDYGLDFENHIWTTKDLSNDDEARNYAPTMQDLRFEAFNSMAFGASRIDFYCASTPPTVLKANPEFVGGWGCINDGQKTPELFDNAQQLGRELKALSEVFPRYLWQAAAGYDAGGIYGDALVRDAGGSYEGRIGELTSSQDLLIGLFDEANGDGEAFLFVNNCDINAGAEAEVRFSLKGAAGVTAYIGTEVRTLERGADGKYSLPLMPGQGVFVTVQR